MIVDTRARDEAVEWARDLVSRVNWVVLDTETTGLDGTAQVIQVAVVAPDGQTLLDTLARPHGRIPTDVIAIHGITDDMVRDAPAYSEVHRVLGEVIHGRTIVCYNAAFDSRVIEQTARRNALSPHPVTWACAMRMYARYLGQRSARHGGYRYQKLPRSPEYHGLKHQAVDDCRATLELIRRMAG